jgi:hypothetical protein
MPLAFPFLSKEKGEGHSFAAARIFKAALIPPAEEGSNRPEGQSSTGLPVGITVSFV